MKILHFADLHLGVETYGNIDPTTGLSTRMLDILRALDAVVEYAVANKVDLVLFCGDTYKNRDPSQTQQREFAKRIKILSQQGIPVFLLIGNHDLPNAIGRATAVEIFETLAISNIHIANRPDIYRIPTNNGDIQIVALPWLRRSALLSREEDKGLNIEEIGERLQEIMTSMITDLIPDLDPGLPAILAAHVSVSTAKQGTESSMLVGRDPVLMLGNVAQSVFDYVALGHVHRRQALCEEPPVIYAGSLERLDFGDENEDKGFYIVNIDTGESSRQVTYEFHNVDARRFLTIKIDIDLQDSDPVKTILETLGKYQEDIKGAVVRVQISLPKSSENILRDVEIYKMLEEAYYVSVAKEIKQETPAESSGWASEKLVPSEALEIYLEMKKIPEERRKILLEYGENVIKESISGNWENYGG
ncbi:exonuclease SbcCD subunit D [Chloroflexota bacterium]